MKAFPGTSSVRWWVGIAVISGLLISLGSVSTRAFETDQYNLSPEPLGDIGDEVSAHVEQKMRTAIAKLNGEIERRERCLTDRTPGCRSVEVLTKQLAELRSEEALAETVFRALGSGSITRRDLGEWLRSHAFAANNPRYKPAFEETIFRLNLTDYLTQSATIRLWGVEFGIDKLEHFFQQGWTYHEIAKRARSRGRSEAEANRAAIKWGRVSENTFYGLIVSGVYSNADLFANYAGMKFYAGLTRPIKIGGATRAATLRIEKGLWAFDAAGLRENFLKPFISDHLNEALNPSAFRLTLVRSVRREVRRHGCPDWRGRFSDFTRELIEKRTKSLKTWDGEDYGHTQRSRTVTLADTCFDKEKGDARMTRTSPN